MVKLIIIPKFIIFLELGLGRTNMKKQIKKLLLIAGLIVCLAAFASCTASTTTCATHTDANGDYVCDTCGSYMEIPKCTWHVDNDNDGYCDIAGCEEEVVMEMLGISFTSTQCYYDGQEHSIAVKGAPYGAEIEYVWENDTYFSDGEPNVHKNAGTYIITAYVTADGYEDYEATAILQILPKHISVQWADVEEAYPANGNAPKLEYTLIGLSPEDEGDVNLKFSYTYNGKAYDFKTLETGTEEADVTVVATLSDPNYALSSNTNTTTVKFGPNRFTVSFDTGVDGTDFDPERVAGGSPVSQPRAIAKKGYTFAGWYNGNKLWDFENPVNADMTLTAKWDVTEYKVTYVLNGGTNSPDNPETFSIETTDHLHVPTKAGQAFLGWYTDKEMTEPLKKKLSATLADTTIYAKWSDTTFVESESVTGNGAITLTETAVNGSFTYSFYADIKSFDSDSAIYIGRGKDVLDGSYVKITSKDISVYNNLKDETVKTTKAHVLKMEGYVVINLTVSNGKVGIDFYTPSGNGSQYGFEWSGRVGEIFFETENAEFENATFGWGTTAYDELTWIIGDETVGSVTTGSYTQQIIKNKFGYFLTIGAAGLNSDEVLVYFKEACEIKTPKYAIWSFAFDNSENYDDNLEEFVSFCKEKGITPILSTHPSNAMDMTERNAAVVDSGERYIDFASVEGYEKIFDADGNYTEYGARALYAKFMAGFPEIMAAEASMRTEHKDIIEGVDPSLLTPENYDASLDVDAAGNKNVQIGALRLSSKEQVFANAITMKGNAIKDGKFFVFSAEIDGTLTEDQTIMVGHGYMDSTANWLEINGTYSKDVSYQSWGTSKFTPRASKHGLTIKNFITVIVTCDTTRGKGVTIITDGGMVTLNQEINGNAGQLFVSAAGVDLKNVSFSWTCKDYAKDVWVFGDSYLSLGDPARWPTHLYYDKYYTALMVGASGMSTQEGLNQFEDALQYGTPKIVVWLEGMNNGEKNGQKNALYHQSMARFFELCEQHNIKAYVATIPTCPAAEHTIKNNAIYNHTDEFEGKEYVIIDWARAAADDSSETMWFEGMLHTDNVHPTNLGAKALYTQLIVDCPQILGGVDSTVYKQVMENLKSGTTLTVSQPAEKNSVFSFKADFDGKIQGKIEIGNGKGVEGGTWVEIDRTTVTVYRTVNGMSEIVYTVDNKLLFNDVVSISIHVRGDVAKFNMMSAGEIDSDSLGNRVFAFDVSWTQAGDAFASIQGADATNAMFSWHTYN